MDTEHQVIHSRFVQEDYAESSEWRDVCSIAEKLIDHLNSPTTLAQIYSANQPKQSSSEVQKVFLEKATELGFQDESKGLFKDYANHRLRPDYFCKLNESGILIEVERGKTNQNNMDFLDFWKCHICMHAHYLFLCVPQQLKQNSKSNVVSRPYKATLNHMSAFFEPANYTNVRGLFLIGY